MKKNKLKEGGSMVKKIFTAIVLVVLTVYIFSNKSDAANLQKYKEVNFNNSEVVKVADKNESLNDLQQHTNSGQADSLMENGTAKTFGDNGNNQPNISGSNIVTEATTAIVGAFVYFITQGIISPLLAMIANGNGLEFWKGIANGEYFFNVGRVLSNQYELFDS